MDILQACRDDKLFAPWFRDPASWASWHAWLAAMFALPMTDAQLTTYRECTGRTDPPKERVSEAWTCAGRRSGKSFILALTAVYLATFRDWKPHLTSGEPGYVLIVAADRRQSKTIFRYIRALLAEVPMLARLIKQENADSMELTNGIIVEVATCSHKTIRGRTVVACLADEIAFWQGEDSSSSDQQVLDAIRPSMATVPGAVLLCASSPYARRGAMFDAYESFYAKADAPVLFWKAPTRVMNPSVPQKFIDDAYSRDPANADAEYGANFRLDVEALVSRETVMACVTPGIIVRPPERQFRYTCGVDVSSGISDSSVAAISHRSGDTIILDAILEIKAPHSPEVAIDRLAEFAKTYRILRVTGDRYAGEFPREMFRRFGLNYDVSDRSRSDLYRDFLPMLQSRSVDLLDSDKLISQLVGLERRTSRSGKDIIDARPGAKEDSANAVAMACCNTRKSDASLRGPVVHEGCGKYNPTSRAFGTPGAGAYNHE